LDIKSGSQYPSFVLSNFTSHLFVFDGVECSSMEGLLQSFKFDKLYMQIDVCKLVGIEAKRRGQERNNDWRQVQKLWWNGVEYYRDGPEYQQLLDRAFDALAQNANFRKALLATGNSPLTHSIGNTNKLDTCLTEHEFCSRLERLRWKFQQEEGV